MSILDALLPSDNAADTHAVSPVPDRLKNGQRVIILTGDNVEDTEFFYPYYRLAEAGYDVDVVTLEGGKFAGKHGLGLKNTRAISDVTPQDYALLYLPGGKAPATLRKSDAVLAFVRAYAALGRPIAAICHGPQILISADVVRGKQIAAWPEVADELREAGAQFVDEALVEDGLFITARRPGDLPRHLAGVLDVLSGKVTNISRNERRATMPAA